MINSPLQVPIPYSPRFPVSFSSAIVISFNSLASRCSSFQHSKPPHQPLANFFLLTCANRWKWTHHDGQGSAQPLRLHSISTPLISGQFKLVLLYYCRQQKPNAGQPDESTHAELPAAIDTPYTSSEQLTLSPAASIPSVPCQPSVSTASINQLPPRKQGPAQSVRTHSSCIVVILLRHPLRNSTIMFKTPVSLHTLYHRLFHPLALPSSAQPSSTNFDSALDFPSGQNPIACVLIMPNPARHRADAAPSVCFGAST